MTDPNYIDFDAATDDQFKRAAKYAGLAEIGFADQIESDEQLAVNARRCMTNRLVRMGYAQIDASDANFIRCSYRK